jgi:hypothetical protein
LEPSREYCIDFLPLLKLSCWFNRTKLAGNDKKRRIDVAEIKLEDGGQALDTLMSEICGWPIYQDRCAISTQEQELLGMRRYQL